MNRGIAWYLSGATETSGFQPHVADSTGGFQSSVELETLTVKRNSPISNLKITYISPENGTGAALVRVIDSNTVSYLPPGATTAGAAVDLSATDTAVILPGSNVHQHLVVERTNPNPLLGQEALEIKRNFNSGVSWIDCDITDQTSAPVDYYGFFGQPEGAVTDLVIECDSTNYQVSIDTLSDGEMSSSPASLSYDSTASSASGSDTFGLWIKRTSPLTATPSQTVSLNVSFTYDSVNYEYTLSGYYRIYDENLQNFLIYDSDTLIDTVTSEDFPYSISLAEGSHAVEVKRRNMYGLISGSTVQNILMTSGGSEVIQPAAPTSVKVSTVEGGKVRVEGIANRLGDPATVEKWGVFVFPAGEGATIDHYTETEILNPTSAIQYLDCTTAETFSDLQELSVWVYLVAPDDVTGTPIITTYTVDRTVPKISGIDAFYSGNRSQYLPNIEAPDFTEYIDTAEDIRFDINISNNSFYYADTLIWKLVTTSTGTMLYVPSDFTIKLGVSIDETLTTAQPIELKNSKLYVSFGGEKGVLAIDPTGKTIEYDGRSNLQTPSDSTAPRPIWLSASSTLMQNWSSISKDWFTAFDVTEDGYIRSIAGWSTRLSAAQIEAL